MDDDVLLVGGNVNLEFIRQIRVGGVNYNVFSQFSR